MIFRFHNRVAALKSGASFDEVRRKVRWHYQWIVVHDVLTRIVDRAVLDAISPAIADPSKDLASHPPHLHFYRFHDAIAGDEAVADHRLFSLVFRNLVRGKKLRLPSGQDSARAMGVTPLTDAQILIGVAANDAPDEHDGTKTIIEVSLHFAGKCPLWTYVLAEARRSVFHPPTNQALHKVQLGPVGGRIVAEVFLGLLTKDADSSVNAPAPWVPDLGGGRNFSLADLLTMALQG